MSKVKPQYLVSTDSIGFLGKPEQFVKLWKEYFDDGILEGVEVIAFGPISRLNKLMSIFTKNNIFVTSFHGRTGGESLLSFISRITMILVNLIIIDVKKALENFPEIEYLSHAPYLDEKSVQEIILKKKPKKIWIENHLHGKQGVDDAIKQIIFYRKNNINALGMLDVYHYLSHSLENLDESWRGLVEQLRSYILLKDGDGRRLFYGIHFPIGSRLGDSLPIDSMSDDMLELFAERIIPHVERVVFENQQKNIGLFFSTGKMLADQKERNKRIVERLKKTGILISSLD